MPPSSEARPGEAGPCQGKRGRHRHCLGHPFWETPAVVAGRCGQDTAGGSWQPEGTRRLFSPPRASWAPRQGEQD